MTTRPGRPAAEPAPKAPASEPTLVKATLSKAEEGVVAAWLAYGPESNPDEIVGGDRLFTRRGKLYFDGLEGPVCIGSVSRSRPDQKVAYTGHTLAPSDLQLAVAEHVPLADGAPRYHQ